MTYLYALTRTCCIKQHTVGPHVVKRLLALMLNRYGDLSSPESQTTVMRPVSECRRDTLKH